MTYFISPEYQESKAGLPEQEESDKRPVDPPHVFLKKLEGISEAFRTELLSLNEAVPAPHTSPGGALARDKWPNNITRPDLLRQAEEIWRVSRKCGLAFLEASPTALSFLARPEFRQWAALGRVILDADTEDAELCRAYFQISPYLIKNTAFNFVPAWVDQNLIIASLSSKTALAFFRSTPAFLDVDRAFNLKRWAEKARQILDTGKGCEAAAIAFIETSPRIVQKFTFKELLYWGGIGMKIAAISPDSALTYFSEPSEAMDSLYNIEIRKFLDLISALVDEALERAMDFYERCPEDLVALNPKIREQVLDVSRDLADENTGHIIDVFSEIVVSLRPLFFPMQEKVMEKGIAVSKLSLPASRAFFKGMGLVLSEIPDAFLSHWVDKGMACLAESEQAGIDY
ncbi:MAG: hypothetical protein GY849_06990, partial [Deltaproteobacteria bacterium]|nr:hypothetical protein [Deltaproteobacteria bacterium]